MEELEAIIDKALATLQEAKDYHSKSEFYLRAMIQLAIMQLVREHKTTKEPR
jgi:hypothetical protein